MRKRIAIMLLLVLVPTLLVAQQYTNVYETRGDFLNGCELYNCDTEKVEGRVIIGGFFPPTSSNAVVYLSFDETDGKFLDHSTNGNDPSLYKSTGYNNSGKYGGCLNLSTAYASELNIPNSASFRSLQDVRGFTINFWIKLKRAFSETGTYVHLFTFDDGYGLFGFNSGTMSCRYQNYTLDDFDTLVNVSEAPAIPTVGDWHNVWIVRSNDMNYLYIDGVMKGSKERGLEDNGFVGDFILGYWDGASVRAVDAFIDDFYISATNENVIDSEDGIISTKTVDTEGNRVDFVTVTVDKQRLDTAKGEIVLYASSDDGSNWVAVTNGVACEMPSSGQSAYDKLRVRINLVSYDRYVAGEAFGTETYTPEIDSFNVVYSMPRAYLTEAAFARESEVLSVKIDFPYPVDPSSPGTHYVIADGTTNKIPAAVATPAFASDGMSVTFEYTPDSTLEDGYYDFRVEGYRYVTNNREIATTFSKFVIIDNDNNLSENDIAWFPEMINLRNPDTRFQESSLFITSDTPISVSITIFNERGAPVRTLVAGDMRQGVIQYEWDGRDDAGSIVKTGVYYARISLGGKTSVARLFVLQ